MNTFQNLQIFILNFKKYYHNMALKQKFSKVIFRLFIDIGLLFFEGGGGG